MMVSSRKLSKTRTCQAWLVIKMSIVNDKSTKKLKSEARCGRKVRLGAERTSGRGSNWKRLSGLERLEIGETRKMNDFERVTWAWFRNFDIHLSLKCTGPFWPWFALVEPSKVIESRMPVLQKENNGFWPTQGWLSKVFVAQMGVVTMALPRCAPQ